MHLCMHQVRKSTKIRSSIMSEDERVVRLLSTVDVRTIIEKFALQMKYGIPCAKLT